MQAIVLLSGGLDSTVMLARLHEQQIETLAISFDYGQRHRIELECAKKIAAFYQVEHEIIPIEPSIFQGGSALTSSTAPQKGKSKGDILKQSIPITYVPARNTLFLAYALVKAEMHGVQQIHFGSNAMDFLSYPDCRPGYFEAAQNLFNQATKQAVEGKAPQIVTPLLNWSKEEIVKEGYRLKVPFELTSSCYDPTETGLACQQCDACVLRREAFLSHSLG
ncbi:7-cyano-7-deazaguanine synthase QueC [Parachlamydia sp. AcF125]|uniref:7-cyano-7-deazaguanine synthase QueC n=1 Tax=Parachlamydia sp. AcF125 TaxID=2795736 RepID=UPI001BC9C075|nr:7-cyano-7-deazaguanine synthase QueC [Parachlamydia sp. AcF125]MBS4168421.1 7-cyano-7-deazaguanine synthase [Parachlamydia sp. AcF125]